MTILFIHAILLFCAGIILLIFSALLFPYKDQSVMDTAMTRYPASTEDSKEASNQYFLIRDSQLTLKYPLFDYGFCCIITSILIALYVHIFSISRFSDFLAITVSRPRLIVLLTGLCAALVSSAAFVGDLMLSAHRNEFPPWADSLGIPLMAVPVIFCILTVIAIVFYLLFLQKYSSNILIHIIFSIPAVLCVINIIYAAAMGMFIFIPGAFCWTLFFLFMRAEKFNSFRVCYNE